MELVRISDKIGLIFGQDPPEGMSTDMARKLCERSEMRASTWQKRQPTVTGRTLVRSLSELLARELGESGS